MKTKKLMTIFVLAFLPLASVNADMKTVIIGKVDGSLQCEPESGLNLEQMAEEQLESVNIVSSFKQHDGFGRRRSCGYETGMMNAYEISIEDMEKALEKDFVLLPELVAIAEPAADDSTDTNDTNQNIRFSVERPIEIKRATPLNKLHWATITIIDPAPQHKLTPLFGYLISKLPVDRIGDALAATKKAGGDVQIAIVSSREINSGSESDTVYEGRGVHIGIDINEERLFDEWSRFRQIENVQDGDIIAFTRPLHGLEADKEFVGSTLLWASTLALGEEIF